MQIWSSFRSQRFPAASFQNSSMRPDVTEFCTFYASPLGQMALRFVARNIRTLWPDVRGCAVVGLGYAAPFLNMFQGEARMTAALMPEGQGSVPWPRDEPRRVALVSEAQLPLADLSVERMLLVHCLEMCDPAEPLLREVWRVLAPEGKLIIVTPNRRGLWARADSTPFGHGRPYSRRQIDKLLCGAMFTPLTCSPALFAPPLRWRWSHGSAPVWEGAGRALWPAFSGVLVVEAAKQIYALAPDGEAEPSSLRLFPAGSLAAAGNAAAREVNGLNAKASTRAYGAPPAHIRGASLCPHGRTSNRRRRCECVPPGSPQPRRGRR
jgi:SAM-dependent methyltransferase